MTPSSSSARIARGISPSKPSRPYGSSSSTSTPAAWQIARISSRRPRSCEHAGRVVERRDRVEELRALALGGELVERLGERLGHETAVVHRDVTDVGLVRDERLQRADVARRLAQDHVARVDEDAGDEVERLLRAGGDDDVVGVGADALQRHDLDDLLAQRRVALRAGVLQRLRAVLGDQRRGLLADDVERERGQVRHAAGERDDLGPVRDREQRADLRGGHAVGACGVGLDVAVEAVAVHGLEPTVPSCGPARVRHRSGARCEAGRAAADVLTMPYAACRAGSRSQSRARRAARHHVSCRAGPRPPRGFATGGDA